MKTITLDFAGYWTNATTRMLAVSGVYCVYRCIDNGKTVTINVNFLKK